MRLSGASFARSIPGNGFRTVALGIQNGFVESRNNSSRPALRAKIQKHPLGKRKRKLKLKPILERFTNPSQAPFARRIAELGSKGRLTKGAGSNGCATTRTVED
jgi:hypothetical protein